MGCKGATKSTGQKRAPPDDEEDAIQPQAAPYSSSSLIESSSSRRGQSAKAAENGAELASLPKLGPRKALVRWNVLRELGLCWWLLLAGTVALVVSLCVIHFVLGLIFEAGVRAPAVPRAVVIGR